MAFKTGPNLGLKYGAERGRDWEAEGNENFLRLDAFTALRLLEIGAETPPGTPAEGDAYALGDTPTGAWAGQGGDVALYVEGAWRFETPRACLTAFNFDDLTFYVYSDHESAPAWYPLASI